MLTVAADMVSAVVVQAESEVWPFPNPIDSLSVLALSIPIFESVLVAKIGDAA